MGLDSAVRGVTDLDSLRDLLRHELDWPLDPTATVEDSTFEWTADDLRVNDRHAARLSGGVVRQIRPFTANQPWGVFLLQFTDGRVYRTALRDVLRRLVPSRRHDPTMPSWRHDNLLFICTTAGYESFTFAHFRGDDPKRATLARFGWDKGDTHIRTLCEFNLSALTYPHDPSDAASWLTQWQSAFDVEAVTKKFFERYRQVFQQVEGMVKGVPAGDARRLFTQRLFNRLLFVQFLQKKGWLRFEGSTDYLPALLGAAKSRGENFFADRLYWLFFYGLGTLRDMPEAHDLAHLLERRGLVPYLNGGLFEMEDDHDIRGRAEVPNAAFDLMIGDLFARYNFTVTESTPLDVEVAVDPEMLGKVFEELVTGRHETGSYYTPRNVVAFMCREALKGYLWRRMPDVSPEVITAFVDRGDPSHLRDLEAALDALKTVRACDPACGSGAYLLGMMQELLRLRESLFAVRQRDHEKIYNRKLDIIQRNLYGADIDRFAINIAMLRLWLSLVVDDERHPLDDQSADVSLPNLRFKIQVGDSLAAPDPDPSHLVLHRDAYATDAHRLNELYDEYFTPVNTANQRPRRDVERDIESAQAEIAHLIGTQVKAGVVDWRIAFAEVFAPPVSPVQSADRLGEAGFDVVLANPPYVRADAQFKHIEDEAERQREIAKWKAYRKSLVASKVYVTLYEKWDLYMPFLERAHQLLREGGDMVFIVSDAYNRAKYAMRSHQFFVDNSVVSRIDFCTDVPLFEAGVSNTILHFRNAQPSASHCPVRARRWGEKTADFEANVQNLPTRTQREIGLAVFRPDDAAREDFVGMVELSNICYISKGMVIHADERGSQGEFGMDDLLTDVQDAVHAKRFVLGKDVVKWVLRRVRYLEWGTMRAPMKFSRPTFPALHETKEKLIAVRSPGAAAKVMYDDNSLHFDASSVGFIPWRLLKGVRNKSIRKTARYRNETKQGQCTLAIPREELERISEQFDLKYLLALMNSGFASDWLSRRRRSMMHVYPDDWKPFPVPPLAMDRQQELVRFVDAILVEFHEHGCPLPPEAVQRVADLEREIDERVAALYGL